MNEIDEAVKILDSGTQDICIMQCNTNYTGSLENIYYQNLNVLKTFQKKWPKFILGLSDHTAGHSSVLGAISFGARIVEKHFTDDNSRNGPDHSFSMNPESWRLMVESARELESSLGIYEKKVEDNEKETVVVQRRSIRLKFSKKTDEIIELSDLEFLRPCPENSFNPMHTNKIVGKKLVKDKKKGEEIYPEDLS